MAYGSWVLERLAGVSTAGIVLLVLGVAVNFAASALFKRERLSQKAMLAWRLPALAAALLGVILIFMP